MNAILESQITAALGRHRTPFDSRGNRSEAPQKDDRSTWAADYGARNETTTKAALDAARLSHGGGGDSHGDSSFSRENRLDHGGGWTAKALWIAVNRHLCNGTKFFAVCCGVVAFIVVI